MSNRSFFFPEAISRINKGKQGIEDNQSFLEDLEHLEDTILKSPDDFYDSKISNMNDNITLKQRSQLKFKKKKKKTKRKNKKILNDKKIMEFLNMEQQTQTESQLSDDKKFYFSQIVSSQCEDKNKQKEMETDTESEMEDDMERKPIKKVIYRNQIGKFNQNISVSNFNCACRVF
jgi:hypothetical protein